MDQHLLSYNGSQICYYRFGYGLKAMFCFHGFGEDGTLYNFLEKYSGDQFTFYSIDLPFHGKTIWKNEIPFTTRDLQNIIREIIDQNKNGSQNVITGFTLLGFSLGGRAALSLYQAQPDWIEKLVLLAPDGLKVNFWYWFSTQTRLGIRLFSFTMKYPGWFFAFIKILKKTGFINASVFKFVNYYIGNETARQLLFDRWTSLRKLKPDLKLIRNSIKLHRTPTRLVYGKYDRIILPVRGQVFQKDIEEFCTVTIIKSGHQVVHENHIEEILPVLFQ